MFYYTKKTDITFCLTLLNYLTKREGGFGTNPSPYNLTGERHMMQPQRWCHICTILSRICRDICTCSQELIFTSNILICLLSMKKIVSWISVDFKPTFCRPKNWRSPKKLNFFFQISKLFFLCLFDAIKRHTNNFRNSLVCHKKISILFLSLRP